MAAPVASGCSSCGGSSVVGAAPMGGEVIYGTPAASAIYSDGAMESSPVITTEPAVEASSSEDVIEAEASPSDVDADTPAVDPNAFIIRNGNARG